MDRVGNAVSSLVNVWNRNFGGLLHPQAGYTGPLAINLPEQKLISPVVSESYQPPVQPQPQKYPQGTLNFKPHQTETTRKIWEPEQQYKALHQEYFPNEATSSAVTAFNESMYNPKTISPANTGSRAGTRDYGYFQINAGESQGTMPSTFTELWQKFPSQMMKIGAYKPEDLLDVRKNFQVARLVRDYENMAGVSPWSWWHGWKDQGFKNVGKKGIDYNE